jgi:hypothetical protein
MDRFSKYTDTNFYEYRSVGAELFHVNGQTDMTKLIVAFRDFANAPKKSLAPYSDSSPGPSTL